LHTLGRHVDNPPNIIPGHEFAGVVAQVNSAPYEHLRKLYPFAFIHRFNVRGWHRHISAASFGVITGSPATNAHLRLPPPKGAVLLQVRLNRHPCNRTERKVFSGDLTHSVLVFLGDSDDEFDGLDFSGVRARLLCLVFV